MSADETTFIDCPECNGKEALKIDRWFVLYEAMEPGFSSWEEKYSECGYEASYYDD